MTNGVKRRAARLTLLLAVLAGLAGGCETVKGLGRDVESAGSAGQRAISGDRASSSSSTTPAPATRGAD